MRLSNALFCVVACMLLASPVSAAPPTIENDSVRVQAIEQGEGMVLRFDARKPGESWRTVLSTAAQTKGVPWDRVERTAIEDIEIDATGDDRADRESFFTEAAVEPDGKTLVVRGRAGIHHVTQRITLRGDGHLYVAVEDAIKEPKGDVEVGRLMSHFYFVPDNRAMGYALPMDFAWLPNLHRNEAGVCGDHFFRSPAVIVVSRGLGAAIVPDLDLMAKDRQTPHALDLRSHQHKGAGGAYGVPRLSYGLCPWRIDGHVYTSPGDRVTVSADKLQYAFDLFIEPAEDGQSISTRVTSHLWKRYGSKYFRDIRPQVLPFEDYGRRYSYVHELKRWATKTTLDDVECYGIKNDFRRGANFHAWENDLHTGFGVWYYGRKWGNEELQRIGKGILNLSLAAPSKDGAFPCVYNFDENKWEGSLYWTSWPADPFDGYDIQSMGVSAYLRLYWHECFPSLRSPKLLKGVVDLAHFFADAQLPSGAVPTYYDAELRPAGQLKQSAVTSIAGAVMARAAMITQDEKLEQAAIEAGRFLQREILPTTNFQDFEVFYSCSPKPLYWVDPVNGIRPVDTLAIQWSADHFLALYQLTGEQHWLDMGEHCLAVLSLFQQVWAPPFYNQYYLYGGFGVMNTDGEWNDGRQARFAMTYADYFRETGNVEYLERSVAAVRASMALMDFKENHANRINFITRSEGPGQGYSSENILHGGLYDGWGGWTGYNWGGAGGIASAASLAHHFGSVWVDGRTERAVPIDGASAQITAWQDDRIAMKIGNALAELPYPYLDARKMTVKFGHLPLDRYTVVINGQEFKDIARQQLTSGVEITLPEVDGKTLEP